MNELRTQAVEKGDDYSVGYWASLLLLLRRSNAETMDGVEGVDWLFGERGEARFKAQLADEFEKSEPELERIVEVAERDLPRWIKVLRALLTRDK